MINGIQDRIDRRFRRLAAEAEQGLTLVELLVAIMLLGLLLIVVGGAFSTISKTVTLATNTNQNVAFSSLGMSEMSKVLRFATTNPVLNQPIDSSAFVSANKETLTVYSYVDANATTPTPTEVTFSLDSSRRLVETRYASYSVATGFYAFRTTPYLTRILTGIVLAPTATQLSLFTYLDASGNALPPGTSGLTTAASGSTPSQVSQVAAVEVTLKIKGNTTNGASPIVMQNTVGLPNLGLSRTGQDVP